MKERKIYWDFITRSGEHAQGSAYISASTSFQVCREFCMQYGPGTHWITDDDDNVLYTYPASHYDVVVKHIAGLSAAIH